MKRTGEMLQKAREEKGLSLNEIALSLKINSKVLSAIESGDTSKLPAKTFLRGFVQSYANYLKINTDQVMEVFSEEMGVTRPMTSADQPPVSPDGTTPPEQAPIAHREEPVLSQIEKRNNTKLFVITGICLVLVCLIFVTARIVDRYQKETITEEVRVSSPLPDDSVPEPEAEPITEEAEAAAPLTPAPAPTAAPAPVTPKPAAAPTSTPAAEVSTASAAVPPPKVVETPKPVEAKPVTPPPATTPPVAETPKPSEPEKKPAGRSLEMIIEALDNVEIEYGSGSGPLRKVQLGPDRVHTIRSREGLRLNINNGGAVNLNLNGRDLGIPGDLGKPVKLSY